MSIYRAPLLLLVAVCAQKSFTPPQAPASQEAQDRVPPGVVERITRAFIRWPVLNVINLEKSMVWIPALVESALVLAQEGYLPAHWSSMIMDTCAGPITRGQLLSPLVVAGAALALAGTAFRLSAYRTLGRHFTFELAVQKDHALVTAYPYNIVRHPSYTGYLATMAGAGLALGTRDGWVRAALVPWLARAPATPAKVSAAAYGGLGLGLYAFMAGMFLWRVGAEDAMMRKQFGPQWDAWARRVPYEIVPFVF